MNREKPTAPGKTARIMTIVTLLLALVMLSAGCMLVTFPSIAGGAVMSTIFGDCLFGTSCRIIAYGICFALGTDIAEQRRNTHI